MCKKRVWTPDLIKDFSLYENPLQQKAVGEFIHFHQNLTMSTLSPAHQILLRTQMKFMQ